MTVAPPLSRLHPVSALTVTALLCVCLAWPAVAKPPEGKGPPAKSKVGGQSGKSGHAHDRAKPTAAPRGQSRKGLVKAAPGQVKRSASGTKKTPPGQLRKSAPGATPGGRSKPPQSAPKASGKRSARPARARVAARAKARAAARARARTAARARATARTAARRSRQTRPAAPAASGMSTPPAEGASEPKKESQSREGPRFAPVLTDDDLPQPLRVVRDVVEVVPTSVQILLAGLSALLVLLAVASGLTLLRNRRLAAHRRHLLGEVGLLQAALLPEVPTGLDGCRISVAYRPADGPAAGGDFYDIVDLGGGQTALLIGDVSGHGRAALGRTALTRYTLRAYLEAGLGPRESLQIAGSVLAGKLQGDFVTALVAIHDAATGTLTYATAGHPPPIVASGPAIEPILVGTAPPLGLGASTGQRQTTLPFARGAVACFYTDGLSEARTADGQLGSARLGELIRELGPDVTAQQVIDRVASSADTIADDVAACVIAAPGGSGILRSRLELLEVTRAELRGPVLRGFLEACGVDPQGIRRAERDARDLARRTGTAVVEVRLGERPQVDVRAPGSPAVDGALGHLGQPSALGS